ncbi:hypothetical protein [Streptomyces sp. NBC_01725]|nr:hypothetical protein [Streptomyces sp. NBC_01725]
MTNAETGDPLQAREATVRAHVGRRILTGPGVSNRVRAALVARGLAG